MEVFTIKVSPGGPLISESQCSIGRARTINLLYCKKEEYIIRIIEKRRLGTLSQLRYEDYYRGMEEIITSGEREERELPIGFPRGAPLSNKKREKRNWRLL